MIDVAPFEALLRSRIGLDAASIGSSAVRRAVEQRMLSRNASDGEAYLDLIANSPDELQEMIEAVVVPETWFFRDPASFAALVHALGEYRRPERSSCALRLLSAPCSTGEEPCSIAMALLDAGFAPGAFSVDAVDISARALAQAERGQYGRNSFRAADLGFRDRHFAVTDGAYRVADDVRSVVQYRQGNLLDGIAAGTELYDAVFCRNVLIYFDDAAQQRAIGVLRRLLKPGGWLFVGPAEPALLSGHGFVSSGLPLAFAFRKASLSDRTEARRTEKRTKIVRPPASQPQFAPTVRAQPTIVAGKMRVQAEPPASIERATRLADEGDFTQAAADCEAYLRTQGPSADAFHLLGLLGDARGNADDAIEQYRKALYLDPNHYETLIHLALLLRRRGDAAAAKLLQKRAKRAQLNVAAQHVDVHAHGR